MDVQGKYPFLSEIISDFHNFYNKRNLQNDSFDGLRKSYFLVHAEEVDLKTFF